MALLDLSFRIGLFFLHLAGRAVLGLGCFVFLFAEQAVGFLDQRGVLLVLRLIAFELIELHLGIAEAGGGLGFGRLQGKRTVEGFHGFLVVRSGHGGFPVGHLLLEVLLHVGLALLLRVILLHQPRDLAAYLLGVLQVPRDLAGGGVELGLADGLLQHTEVDAGQFGEQRHFHVHAVAASALLFRDVTRVNGDVLGHETALAVNDLIVAAVVEVELVLSARVRSGLRQLRAVLEHAYQHTVQLLGADVVLHRAIHVHVVHLPEEQGGQADGHDRPKQSRSHHHP